MKNVLLFTVLTQKVIFEASLFYISYVHIRVSSAELQKNSSYDLGSIFHVFWIV